MIYEGNQLAAALVIATMILCLVAVISILLLFRRAASASHDTKWEEHQTFLLIEEARSIIDTDQAQDSKS